MSTQKLLNLSYIGGSVFSFQPGMENYVRRLFREILRWLANETMFDLSFDSPYDGHLYLEAVATEDLRGTLLVKHDDPAALSQDITARLPEFEVKVTEGPVKFSFYVDIPQILGFRILIIKVGKP